MDKPIEQLTYTTERRNGALFTVWSDGTVLPVVRGGDGPVEDAPPEFVLPEDLTAVEGLPALEAEAVAAFDALDALEASPQVVQSQGALAEAIAAIRAEQTRRDEEVAQLEQEREAQRAQVHASDEPAPGGDDEPETPAEPAPDAPAEGDEPAPDAPAPDAPAEDATREPVAASGPRRIPLPMGRMRQETPEPAMDDDTLPVIVAAAEVPNIARGGRITSLAQLNQAFHERARTLPDRSGEVLVASILREAPADMTLTLDATPEQVTRVLDRVLNVEAMVAAGSWAGAARDAALTAAGGWCAPSENLYRFFDISCADGIWDVPTIPAGRGGIRWPGSVDLASILALGTDAFWIWTEADDMAATGEGGPTKPCIRIPCPEWDEARWDAHGICVTSGNLTDETFPEQRQHFMGVFNNAHEHVMNARRLAQALALSTSVTGTGVAAGGVLAPLMGNIDLQANDLRAKYGMCDDAVVEVVLPRWVRGAIRSDLAKRQGIEPGTISDAEIASQFSARFVRVQWVEDWQVRSAGFPGHAAFSAAGEWPTNVQFLMYPAGTFALATGPKINLGVQRDSVLNATNDHTLAWSEETFVVVRFGPEARVVTVPICANGAVAQAIDLGCNA